ncbi:hypothetical protein F7725_014363 [Dissostichus mawsoni]|uniref:Uncharacterized protein n=1 Tax=Dissostichus mawsoni TaxID=36200 RepID=A0A7J5YVX9_DISMA|nr:hypothetical protein F7725_014363 [Dissostichus mawsoni]
MGESQRPLCLLSSCPEASSQDFLFGETEREWTGYQRSKRLTSNNHSATVQSVKEVMLPFKVLSQEVDL